MLTGFLGTQPLAKSAALCTLLHAVLYSLQSAGSFRMLACGTVTSQPLALNGSVGLVLSLKPAGNDPGKLPSSETLKEISPTA